VGGGISVNRGRYAGVERKRGREASNCFLSRRGEAGIVTRMVLDWNGGLGAVWEGKGARGAALCLGADTGSLVTAVLKRPGKAATED